MTQQRSQPAAAAPVSAQVHRLLTDPTLEAKIAADAQANAQVDAAGRQAATEPCPGALADVFAAPSAIAVGPYQVRPFYDGDFENLKRLGHPLGQMLVAGMGGQVPQANLEYKPQGQDAWVLAWMFTRPIDEVDEAIAKGQVDAAAKQAIGNKLQLGALVALNKAVITQLDRYWRTVLGYTAGGEGEQSSPPPP